MMTEDEADQLSAPPMPRQGVEESVKIVKYTEKADAIAHRAGIKDYTYWAIEGNVTGKIFHTEESLEAAEDFLYGPPRRRNYEEVWDGDVQIN